jgi:DNA (cytosine-5)-methyltransferase 1
MNYLSVCSGIEAATVAWHSLGWTPLAFSEIEKFPSQVLAHHYPNTPNLGDMTRYKEWNFGSNVNVLVGGTPCQSFSVAGLRKGLDDPRGNLMLTYLAIAAKQRPKWVVWENVPGVLSSNGGLDFASFLRGLGQLGYGFAYRVLDAQYFGVAQRRRRVFVVGCAGDWRAAAAVLFERHSLQGHPAPSREKGQRVANSLVDRPDRGGGNSEGQRLIAKPHAYISPALKARDAKGPSSDGDGDGAILVPMSRPIALQDVRAVEKMQNGKGWNDDGTAYTVDTYATQGVMQPIPFDTTQITSPQNGNNPQAGNPCHPLAAGAHPPAICLMDQSGSVMTIENDITGTLRRETHGHEPVVMAFDWQSGGDARGLDPKPTAQLQRSQTPAVMQSMAVRRLTVVECERLQGFPDNYTDIQPKGKATPDGPRYKALGNSMAVPVMRWIGERIAQVEGIA